MELIVNKIDKKIEAILKDQDNIEELKNILYKIRVYDTDKFKEILTILRTINNTYIPIYNNNNTMVMYLETKYQLFSKYKKYLYQFLNSQGIKNYKKWEKENKLKSKLIKIELNQFSYILFKKQLEKSKLLSAQEALLYHKQIYNLIDDTSNIPQIIYDFNNLIWKHTIKSQTYLKFIFNKDLNFINRYINITSVDIINNYYLDDIDIVIDLYYFRQLIEYYNIPLILYIYTFIPSELPLVHSTSKFNTKKMSYKYYIYLFSILITLKYLNKNRPINKSLKTIIINLEKILNNVVNTDQIKRAKKYIQQFYNNYGICMKIYKNILE